MGWTARPTRLVHSVSTMDITELVTAEQFGGMRDEWNALVDESANPLFYSRHEWLWTWWKHYGSEVPLHIICVRQGGTLRGVFPLTMGRLSIRGLLHIRCAQFIAQRETSYQDVVLSRGWERKVIRNVLAYLRDKHPECQMLYATKVHPASALVSPSSRGGLDGWWTTVSSSRSVSPFALLPTRYQDYLEGLSRDVRSCVARARKKADRLGTVAFVSESQLGHVPGSWLDSFFRCHEARWGLAALEARGYRRYRPFVTEAFQASLDAGTGRYLGLMLGDRWIAGQLCLDYAGTRSLLMLAHDPDFGQLSPGLLLGLWAVEDAIERDLSRFDYGAGDETYKSHFACHRVEARSVIVSQKRCLGQLMQFCQRPVR